MVLALRPFHAYLHRVVGLNNTRIFRFALSNCATSFPVLLKLHSTRHCCWHRNFQLSSSIYRDILEFLTIRINEVNTTQSSGIIELWFLDSPLLLFFAY